MEPVVWWQKPHAFIGYRGTRQIGKCFRTAQGWAPCTADNRWLLPFGQGLPLDEAMKLVLAAAEPDIFAS